MTERKLASIRTIDNLLPIEGADMIELALIDGWQVVVKKGEFKIGDSCLYFEIDSFLPIRKEFNFLQKSCFKVHPTLGEGYRLRTIKLRGQLSQGLALPVFSILTKEDIDNVQDEYDLDTIIGVKKWEDPIPAQLAGRIRGNFPSDIPKTDQERIQNLFKTFNNRWQDHAWEVTLKLDGSSMTIFRKGKMFGVCSRNLNLYETDDNTFWQVARTKRIEELLIEHNLDEIAIQGELMGPGVQKNREGLQHHDFYVYDIYDIRKGKYLDGYMRQEICSKLGVKHVPIIDPALIMEGWTLERILKYAERPSIKNPVAEGVVFKSLIDPEISFKAISNAYLLGEK